MTIVDKIDAGINVTLNMAFDNEQLNNLEAAALFGIVIVGRQNLSTLQVLYNHAHDDDLKSILKKAITDHTKPLVEKAEKILNEAKADCPEIHFADRKLYDTPLTISEDARFSDREIALLLGNMARASQVAVLNALSYTYKPEIALIYRDTLETAFDFDYRLLKITLEKGWLPHLPKIEH